MEMLQAIFESSIEGILVADMQGVILRVNPACAKMFGYTPAEMEGRSTEILNPLKDSEKHAKFREKYDHQYARSSDSADLFYRVMTRRDGTKITLELRYSYAIIESEKVRIAFMMDMTEKHLIEEVVTIKSKSEALLQTLPDVMIVYDKFGNHLELHAPPNFKLAAAYDDHIGQNIDAILPPHVCEIIRQGFADCEKTKATQTIEYSFVISDSLRHLESRIIQTNEGNFLTIVRDVTEKKIAEQELMESREQLRLYADDLERKVQVRTAELSAMVRKMVETNLELGDQIEETKVAQKRALESQNLYKAIVQYLPNAMIMIYDCDFKLLRFEGEEIKKLGFEVENEIGKQLADLSAIPSDLLKDAQAHVTQTLAGKHLTYDLDLGPNSYRVNSTPLHNRKGEVYQALMVFTNMTDRKELELEMVEALKREQELNEMKSRFVSMASHEFRTPLSVILSAAELIVLQNGVGKEESRLKNVERIKSNVKHLIRLLNDFLSLEKMTAGAIKTQAEDFEMVGFAKTILEELDDNKKGGQEILLSTQPTAIEVKMNKEITKNILFNLLSNAIKYSREGQTINLDLTAQNAKLQVEVRDRGIGIPAEEQKELFTRFFRAHNVTHIQGTGLGLHIVKKYLEILGGDIAFKSQLNSGTTFTITLPLKVA